MQLSFFAVAATCKFDLLTDFAGGLNFMALAILSFVDGGHFHTRQAVITAIVLVCRAELGLFLLFRVCKRGSDARFDEIRGKFLSFLGFWVFQVGCGIVSLACFACLCICICICVCVCLCA